MTQPPISTNEVQTQYIEELERLFDDNWDDIYDLANWYAVFAKMADAVEREFHEHEDTIFPGDRWETFKYAAMNDWKGWVDPNEAVADNEKPKFKVTQEVWFLRSNKTMQGTVMQIKEKREISEVGTDIIRVYIVAVEGIGRLEYSDEEPLFATKEELLASL